ncbi:MAG: hypothetical protein ABFS23_05080 [Pseudomonadota bacterium]
MESIQFRRFYSRRVLLQMLVLAVITLILLVWKADEVYDIYFRDQLTAVGVTVNAIIVALFLLGVLRIALLLAGYSREENAVARLLRNLTKREDNPLRGVGGGRLVSQRYLIMQHLYENNTPINHAALASTLVASESTRMSFPRFINNVLILTGVFGTIIALSIALIGASDLLENAVNVGGMGMVVHGMSTALSTTMTAIGCYLYFGYFYLKVTDAQTNLVSAIEQITTNYLISRFQVHEDTVVHRFSGLLKGLQLLVKEMSKSQETFSEMEGTLSRALEDHRHQLQELPQEINDLKRILRTGFRLPEDA